MVAAGGGSRFGAAKQYEMLDGQRVVDWAIAAARAVVDGVVLVVPPERVQRAEPAVDVVVGGGDRRSASVRAGLACVPDSAEVIVVHDAARPLAPRALFDAVVAAVRAGADGAVPAVPVSDTIKQVVDDVVIRTLERASLVAVQTPQAFRAAALREAHHGGDDATDDAALVETMGGRVEVVPGAPGNFKITGPADLDRARDVLRRLRGSSA